MRRKGIVEDEAMQRYVLSHSEPLEDHHLALIEETRERFDGRRSLQVVPEQALALRMLTRLSGARHALEIGTFTGLSAMVIAEALGSGGRLVCLDIDPETTQIAREHWARAGVGDRIELRLGPAVETLAGMTGERFDLVFLDADKAGYIDYFEAVVPMLDVGGFVIADNTLRRNAVTDPSRTDPTTEAIRRFNRHVADDPRVEAVVLPVYDGMTLMRRR